MTNMDTDMDVSHNGGTPNSWMVYKGKSLQMDDLGAPLFQETSMWIHASGYEK